MDGLALRHRGVISDPAPPAGHDGCSHPGCTQAVLNHRWAHLRAQTDGWFFQRNNTAWCPDHVPDWVPAWRAKRDEENGS